MRLKIPGELKKYCNTMEAIPLEIILVENEKMVEENICAKEYIDFESDARILFLRNTASNVLPYIYYINHEMFKHDTRRKEKI